MKTMINMADNLMQVAQKSIGSIDYPQSLLR
jgi:hypothetical protein